MADLNPNGKPRPDQRSDYIGLAETMAGVGYWRYDIASGQVAWSDAIYEIYGIDRNTFDPNIDSALSFYHPEDRERLEGLMAAAIASASGYEHQLRLLRADGEMRDVVSKAACELGPDGTPAAMFGVFQDITVYSRALRGAQRAEARYRLLAENVGDVITRIRLDGSSNYISPAIERLLGFRPEEMVGRSAQAFVHEEDRPLILEAFRDLGAGLDRKTVEHRAVHKDGHIVWVETHFQHLRSGDNEPPEIIAVIRDVSERRALQMATVLARDQAQEQARRARVAERLAGVGHWRMDLRTNAIEWSEQMYDLYGLPQGSEIKLDEVMGMTHSEDRAVAEERVANSRSQHLAETTSVTRILRSDGELRLLNGTRATEAGPDGAIVALFGTAVDITEQNSLQVALTAAREAAEQAASAKADFLANMSHELRTPLNSIVGFAGLVAQAPELTPATLRQAMLVRAASESLVAIVNDILDFSKMDSEGVKLSLEPADLGALLIATADLVQAEAEKKNLTLTVTVQRSQQRIVDPARLRQVILNLLSNAIKFTTQGSVSLSLSETAAGHLKIAVRDTGAGVASDKLEHIFDRFAQADDSILRKHGGTGLGLAISKRLVEAMGGEIGVSSSEHAGSTFWFTFNPSVAEILTHRPLSSKKIQISLDGVRILLADDNELNRELFCALLEESGATVVQARDGAQAVRAVQEETFDIVFMDVQMPTLDGVEATRRIRLSGNLSLPIVALTANVLQSQVDRYLGAGMSAHLAKPFSARSIRAVIEEFVPATSVASNSAFLIDEVILDDLASSIGRPKLDNFLGKLSQQLREMATLLQQTDTPRSSIGAAAHSLRGLAGSLGFVGVARAYASLEEACGLEGDLSSIVQTARKSTEETLTEISLRRAA